jgi:nucleoside-diphosphate-sugar epimerase
MTNTTTNPQELHVIFGTGPLGKSAARELVRRGKHVRMVNRSGKATDLPASVEVIGGDAYDANFTRKITTGAAAVYQCAQPEYHEWQAKFPPLQAAIMEGVIANQAKFIVGDNLYLYGAPNGKPLTENSPVNPISRKGKVRAQMAQAVMDAHEKGKIRAAIGRASTFFGPEYPLSGEFVFYPLLAGKKATMYGNMHIPHSYSYVVDYGTGLAVLGTDDRALGQAWITPVLPAITQQDLLRLVYKEIGKSGEPGAQVAGRLMMGFFGLFSPGARETVEMMYEFEKPYIVDSSKFETTFGVKATPIEQAIRDSVAWFKAHPETAHK